MPKTTERPDAVGADADACVLDENDPLLKDEINDDWMDLMTDRMHREFARQVIQQEQMPATTNNKTRLDNIRALDSLQRQLERIARQQTVRTIRKAAKHARNPELAFQALERRLFDQLEDQRETAIPQGTER